MTSIIQIRPAVRGDKFWIAKAMRIASGGIVDFLFSDLSSNLSVEQWLSLEIVRDNSPLSYKNTLIAVINNEIVGVVNAYPGECFSLPEKNNFIFSPNKVEILSPFYTVNLEYTFYIDTLFVQEKFRGKNIARTLLEEKFLLAKRNGFSVVSLYVWENNATAIALYRKLGFVLVQSVKSYFHPFQNQSRLLFCKYW
ncbi:MAG: N-acetyltransferase [Gammaproteobacteria bacterium]